MCYCPHVIAGPHCSLLQHFYDGLEAEAALVLNGYDFDGRSLRVEKSKSYVRRTPGQKESVSRTVYHHTLWLYSHLGIPR